MRRGRTGRVRTGREGTGRDGTEGTGRGWEGEREEERAMDDSGRGRDGDGGRGPGGLRKAGRPIAHSNSIRRVQEKWSPASYQVGNTRCQGEEEHYLLFTFLTVALNNYVRSKTSAELEDNRPNAQWIAS